MKKIFTVLIFLSLIFIILESYMDNTIKIKSVMSEEIVSNTYSDYDLIFDKEILNLSNFKLKLALFTSYQYQIKRIYFDYNYNKDLNKKEYFSFIGNNLNEGIDNLREQYYLINNNKLITDNYIKIRKIRIYTVDKAIEIFKDKYPKVKVDRIN